MAITTLSGVVTGLQPPSHFVKTTVSGEASNTWVSSLYANGTPQAGVAPSPGLDGAALTSYAGQLPFQNPASGNAYLAGMYGSGANGATNGFWLYCDRLWHNSGITVTTTTEQAITSPTWPARDRNGATDGDGVFVGIEVSAALGNAGAVTNTTLNYTNSSGTSGRTGTIASVTATFAANSFIFFELQSGDVGIRSVQGLTLGTSYVSGTMHLVAVRPIMQLLFNNAPMVQDFFADAIACGLPRLYDNTVPYLLSVGNTSGFPDTLMTVQYAHG